MLVVLDVFSRFIFLRPLQSKSSAEVASVVMQIYLVMLVHLRSFKCKCMLKGKQAFFMRAILSLSPCNLLQNTPVPYSSDNTHECHYYHTIPHNFYQNNLLTMSSLSVAFLSEQQL